MRMPPLFAAFAATAAAARNVTFGSAPSAGPTAGANDTQAGLWAHMDDHAQALEDHLARENRQARHHRLATRASGQPYVPLTSQNGLCVDVRDNALRNGGQLQLWQCGGSANQAWRIEGPLLQTGADMCLDVPGGNGYSGAALQVWKCDGKNPNQHWEQVGSNLRWYGHNLCLDVKDGGFWSGNALQLWTCYYSSANQGFLFGQPAQAVTPGVTDTSSFLGYPTIGWQAFLNKHPVLASFAQAFPQAAAQYNLVPTLLASIALQESSGNCAPSNGAGLMQFTDWNAWQAYGNGGSRENCYDAVWAGARYIRVLLDENGQNLDNALRAYNGPIAYGGKPEYQQDIRNWMTGVLVYGAGT